MDKVIIFLVELVNKLLRGRSHEELLVYAKAKRERRIFRKADKALWKELDKVHKKDPIGYAYFVQDFKSKYQNNEVALRSYINTYKKNQEKKK